MNEWINVFLLIRIVELDHWRLVAKTVINKMGLNSQVTIIWIALLTMQIHEEYLCYLICLIIASLRHILSLHFTVLIQFEEYWIIFFVFFFVSEMINACSYLQ